MNTISRFTINPNSKKSLSPDEYSFIDELEMSKEIGYEFPHYFDSEDSITGYRAIIIESEEIDIERIKKIYGIEPNHIYTNKQKKHLIFYSNKSLNKFDYNRLSKALAFLYNGKPIEYHFYPKNGIIEEHSSAKINNKLGEICTKIYFFGEQSVNYQKALTVSEYDKYIETTKIPILEVISEIYKKNPLKLEDIKAGADEKLNIHKDYGYPFELVNKYYGSIEKAKNFFHKNFDIGFEETNSLSFERSTDGVIVREGENLYLNNFGYFSLDNTGNKKRITDFYIKVHSKIVSSDGKHHFIVSLVNEEEGTETQKIIWENKTSSGTFSDFIQSYGSFHFYGSTAFIKELHKQISTTKQVPVVTQVVGFGHHKEHDIIIFKNGIWDIKERLFTEKEDENDDFYYNYNSKGYWVTDKQSNGLSSILTDGVPQLNLGEILSLDDMLDFINTLYADNSGPYMIFLALGMMGYLVYGDQTKQFPLIFTRGVTGSGKSMYNELLQKIWGIDKAGTDFENSSLFTMTVTLSYMIKFPYFIAEYREAATMRLQKVGTLRSVFDKISQTKGRADQSVVKYDYVATPVLDGEEMIEDGALRTRSLQLQLLNKHKIKGNFNKLVREGGKTLDSILFSYLIKSDGEKYQEYLDEGYEIFKPLTSQNRIAQNIANIYAGCMAFDSKSRSKELYVIVLSEIITFQEEDVQENSTSMQILKVLSKFMENTYSGVHAKQNEVVISWNALEDYVNRYRIDTTLKIKSYKEHLIMMGFNIEFVEAGHGLLEGIRIPYKIIPKNLLVHPETYEAYKAWKKDKQ